MLYEMAQRYDGNTGKSWEETSTLRGALKGWSRTGAARDELWPYDPHDEDNSVHGTLTLARLLDARTRPLRSYRKIREHRVDAMKGALADGHVLYVSARLHAGWYRLFLRDDDDHPVITILPGEEPLGGHAFVIVGYDDERAAFWVHNSWGPEWGVEGYALLPYADWEARGQDAWVVDIEPPLSRDGDVAGDVASGRADRRLPPRPSRTATCGRIWWCCATTAGWRRTASTRWTRDPSAPCSSSSRRRPSSGSAGVWRSWSTADTSRLRRRSNVNERVRDRLMNDEIYPIFVVWETSWWSDLEDELSEWLERFRGLTGSCRRRTRGDRSVDRGTPLVRGRPPVIGRVRVTGRWRQAARRGDHDQAEPTTHAQARPLRSPSRVPRRRRPPRHRTGRVAATADLDGDRSRPGDGRADLRGCVRRPARPRSARSSGGRDPRCSRGGRRSCRAPRPVVPPAHPRTSDRSRRGRVAVAAGGRAGHGCRGSDHVVEDRLGAHRDAGRLTCVDVSESSHLDLVWDVAVHDSLVGTMRSHESSFVRLPTVQSDPLASARAALRER